MKVLRSGLILSIHLLLICLIWLLAAVRRVLLILVRQEQFSLNRQLLPCVRRRLCLSLVMHTSCTWQAWLVMLLVHRCRPSSIRVLPTVAHIGLRIIKDIALALHCCSCLVNLLALLHLLRRIWRLSIRPFLLEHDLLSVSWIFALWLVSHVHDIVKLLRDLVKWLGRLQLHSHFGFLVLRLVLLHLVLALRLHGLLPCVLGLVVLKRKMDRGFFGLARLVQDELPLAELPLVRGWSSRWLDRQLQGRFGDNWGGGLIYGIHCLSLTLIFRSRTRFLSFNFLLNYLLMTPRGNNWSRWTTFLYRIHPFTPKLIGWSRQDWATVACLNSILNLLSCSVCIIWIEHELLNSLCCGRLRYLRIFF